MTRKVMTPKGEFDSLTSACLAYGKPLYYQFKTQPDKFYYISEHLGRKKTIIKNRQKYWHIRPEFANGLLVNSLPDPRLALVKHIEWQSPRYNKTSWSFPEPDNINAAIWHQRPQEIPDIKYQIWYQDPILSGWFSLYYIEDQAIFEQYCTDHQIAASWFKPNAMGRRLQMTLIEREINDTRGHNKVSQHTLPERLIDMGFTQRLNQLGLEQDYLLKSIGEIRPHLKEQVKVLEDEEVD